MGALFDVLTPFSLLRISFVFVDHERLLRLHSRMVTSLHIRVPPDASRLEFSTTGSLPGFTTPSSMLHTL